MWWLLSTYVASIVLVYSVIRIIAWLIGTNWTMGDRLMIIGISLLPIFNVIAAAGIIMSAIEENGCLNEKVKAFLDKKVSW